MKPLDCEFESEVLAAALQSRWPEHVDDDLRSHVSTCPVCSDVAAVAGTMDAEREGMRAGATLPDSGRIWWMAQLRARREAAEAAVRPITAAQLIAFACAVGLLGACFGARSIWFQSALRRIASAMTGFDIKGLFNSTAALVAQHGALAVGMAAALLVVPAAIYLALGRD